MNKLLSKKRSASILYILFLIFSLVLVLIIIKKPTKLFSDAAVFRNQFRYRYDKVILISWDGTQRAHLDELISQDRLPNLQNLIRIGGIRDIKINTTNCNSENDGDNYQTVTGPAYSAMLTGYGYPTQNNHSNTEPGPIPQGYTIFERLKQKRPEIKTAMITGKGLSFFPFPAFENAAPNTCCYTTPSYNQGQTLCGKTDPAIASLDKCTLSNIPYNVTVNNALEAIDQYFNSPFFIFVVFRDPDQQGHGFGENSQEYTDAITNSDLALGQITDKLREKSILDETLILVTADHGFNENGTSHVICDDHTKNLFLVSSVPKIISNQKSPPWQTSITPTIYDVFGIVNTFSPRMSGKSLVENPPFSLRDRSNRFERR